MLPSESGVWPEAAMVEHDFVENLFVAELHQLARSFTRRTYYTERDIVFTLQTRLTEALRHREPSVQVFNDYKLLPTARADLVVVDESQHFPAVLAVEFKYEPDRRRQDIPAGKFPVTSWTEITKDIARAEVFVVEERARVGYAVLIDEDGRYRDRAHPAFGQMIAMGRPDTAGGSAACWVQRFSSVG